jgi:hypothetical protein
LRLVAAERGVFAPVPVGVGLVALLDSVELEREWWCGMTLSRILCKPLPVIVVVWVDEAR